MKNIESKNIQNNIDWILESDKYIRVGGWAYICVGKKVYKNLQFEINDSTGNIIDYKFHRVYRQDLNCLLMDNCDKFAIFGYEIGFKKNESEKYFIKYKYENVEKVKEIEVGADSNITDMYLNENIWKTHSQMLLEDNMCLFNIEQIYIVDDKKIFFRGWIKNIDIEKCIFQVKADECFFDIDFTFDKNEELERYDIEILTEWRDSVEEYQINLKCENNLVIIGNYRIKNKENYIYDKSCISTYIDKTELEMSNIRLMGWSSFDYLPGHYRTVDVCIKNPMGENVDASIKRFERTDLSEMMGDKTGSLTKWAYIIEWACGDFDKYIVEYSANGKIKEETIDVLALKREEREKTYSYPTKAIMHRMITWQRVKDDVYYIFNRGIKEFIKIYGERVGKKKIIYNEWRKWNNLTKNELNKQKNTVFGRMPKISIIVPTYRTPEKFLREMLDSVVNQTYSNWELCIGDGSMDDSVIPILEEYHNRDARILYKRLENNYGISGNTNGALELATGDFIALLDHDDLLTPDALFEVVKAINKGDNVDVVYTDEDKVSLDLKLYFDPHFKPDFNIDLLRSCNYICHFFAADKSIVDKVGGFRSECDGSQDYDFILRCTSAARRIEHVAKCVYNWRCHPASTAMNPESKLYCYEAGKRALELHLEDMNIQGATVVRAENYGYYKVSYPLKEESLVSVIYIRDNKYKEDIQSSIRSKSSYRNLEFISIEKTNNVESVSRLLNKAVEKAKGKYILFVHDGIEVVTKNWIEIMLSNCMRDEVGIVAPKIYNLSETIVHAGYIVGLRDLASRVFVGKNKDEHGYEARLLAQCDLSAVSRDCMMISKELFIKLGGFDEKLIESCEDIDLCLKVRENNLLVMYTSYVEMKCDMVITEFNKSDKEYMKVKWKKQIDNGDYAYNKNFDLKKVDFEL